jgi:hypothetical protein
MQTWFALLFSTICLEGLGRKYLPQIPAVAFYFLKDVVLLFGYYRFRPPADIRRISGYLYRGFGIVWVIAFGWTLIELANPEQGSIVLGLVGLRAYWLWWLAPVLIASVLQNERQKKRAIQLLLVMSTGISLFAIVQFAAPATATVNLYSVVDGEEIYADQTTVQSTGRARVASTFSFITGFQDFTILIPALLLSLGLDAKDRKLRNMAFGATLLASAVIPMSGSRASVLLGGAILVITAWSAGLFFTRAGRRILIGGILAAVLAVTAFPEAFSGVQSRFEDKDETNSRYEGVAMILPPVALALVDYPAMGIGTGMQQNARASLRVFTPWDQEVEAGRYLVELGAIGFLLIWVTKLGLIVALLRSYSILKKGGRRGASAGALSYALLTLNGNLTFDHIWQALYFLGCGFILAEVVSVVRKGAAQAKAATPAPAQIVLGQLAPDQAFGLRSHSRQRLFQPSLSVDETFCQLVHDPGLEMRDAVPSAHRGCLEPHDICVAAGLGLGVQPDGAEVRVHPLELSV